MKEESLLSVSFVEDYRVICSRLSPPSSALCLYPSYFILPPSYLPCARRRSQSKSGEVTMDSMRWMRRSRFS